VGGGGGDAFHEIYATFRFIHQVQKNQAFAICTLAVIVSGDDPQNADGVHLGWF
jgi:hypothetical protein